MSLAKALPYSSAARIVRGFPRRRIVVLGDVMLDRFIRGRVNRISPEAPVPVIRVVEESLVPGGAGNVIHNILALGGRASIVSVVGNDEAGAELLGEFKARGADVEAVLSDPDRPTTQKVRVIAEHQQVVRYDRESVAPPAPAFQAELVSRVRAQLADADALVLSDYGKGILSPKVLRAAIEAASRARVPVIVDPKIEHFALYRGVTCLTPNLDEAFRGMRQLPKEDDGSVEAMGRLILRKLRARSLIITRGERGMSLFERGRVSHLPTQAREVFDVTGAGDTVVSVMALALGSGAGLSAAARLANAAAGVVVGKLGTATASPKELLAALRRGGRPSGRGA